MKNIITNYAMKKIILQETKAVLSEQDQYPVEDFPVEVDDKPYRLSQELNDEGKLQMGGMLLYTSGEKEGAVLKVNERGELVQVRRPGDYAPPESEQVPEPEPAPEPAAEEPAPKVAPAPEKSSVSGSGYTSVTTTPETIGEKGEGILGIGVKGEGVEDLQGMLVKAGYSVGPPGQDGLYGPKTKAAVQQLQKDLGVTPDGIYGPITHKAWQNKEFKKPKKVNESVYNHWQKLIKG